MRAHPAYIEYCKGKSFLASKAVVNDDADEELLLVAGDGGAEQISEFKCKIEVTHGAFIGWGTSFGYGYLKGFKEGEPIGAGQIIQQEELCLPRHTHKDMLRDESDENEGDDCEREDCVEVYREYGRNTKYGHLILAGNPANFMAWVKSNASASRDEVIFCRLFAYIEHTEEDEGGRRGYIVAVDAENFEGEATVSDGIGYVIFHDGSYYHGGLQDGERSGLGKMISGDDCVYDGQWKDGCMHGQGKYTLADGAVYEGQWHNGFMHGRGKYTYASGDVYEGDYRDDIMHGEGTLTHAYGDVYQGGHKDGMMHGKGTFTFANGDVYEGQYQTDRRHGKGKYTFSKNGGDALDGMWKDDEFIVQ